MQNPYPAASNRPAKKALSNSADLLCVKGDALFRAAAESCRQHRHYALLVDRSLGNGEQRRALRMVTLCDKNLLAAADAYERAAAGQPTNHVEPWRRCASTLWLASREYARRHRVTESTAREISVNTAETLGELALEYDLEASALLLVQQAVEAYRKTRPEADLVVAQSRPSS